MKHSKENAFNGATCVYNLYFKVEPKLCLLTYFSVSARSNSVYSLPKYPYFPPRLLTPSVKRLFGWMSPLAITPSVMRFFGLRVPSVITGPAEGEGEGKGGLQSPTFLEILKSY